VPWPCHDSPVKSPSQDPCQPCIVDGGADLLPISVVHGLCSSARDTAHCHHCSGTLPTNHPVTYYYLAPRPMQEAMISCPLLVSKLSHTSQFRGGGRVRHRTGARLHREDSRYLLAISLHCASRPVQSTLSSLTARGIPNDARTMAMTAACLGILQHIYCLLSERIALTATVFRGVLWPETTVGEEKKGAQERARHYQSI
jgi:hypothetical protein